jgi:poly-gamma-glutamate synthesis protein (capsule biosynthesis protein)
MLEPAVNVLQIQQTVPQCDALVVLLHAGPENWHFPPPRMVNLCRVFADAGAAAVLVSHSHAIMGREYHNGVPIFYGLGNFLFDAGPDKNIGWRLGQMTKISFDDGGLVNLELIPVLADAATGCIDLLPEKFMPVFHRFLDAVSEPLQDMSKVEDLWKMFCASQAPHLAKECVKAALAMAPGMLLRPVWRKKKKQTSYYVKGANIFRGLLMCENHQDVLGRIFDLIKTQQFHEYRSKVGHQQSLINQYYQEF